MSSAALAQVCEFDFMRCEKCGRIITKPEMQIAIGAEGTGKACPCGGMKYTPIDLPWWGWGLPRVWAFAWQRVRSQSLSETFRRSPANPEHDHAMRVVKDELAQLQEKR